MTHRNFHHLASIAALSFALSSGGCGLVSTDFSNYDKQSQQSPVDVEPGCHALDLGQATGVLAQGPILPRASADNAGICAGGTADATYLWQAPSSGCYLLSYVSGTVEHQISLQNDTCSGNSLGCWMSYASTESFQAQSGQSFVIGVSFEPGAGTSDFQLAINPSCAR